MFGEWGIAGIDGGSNAGAGAGTGTTGDGAGAGTGGATCQKSISDIDGTFLRISDWGSEHLIFGSEYTS